MKRREFIEKTGCGLAGFIASGTGLASDQGQAPPPPPKRVKYNIVVEIYENKKKRRCHKVGEKFKYSEDIGKICPWFLSSMHDPIILLKQGVTLPWRYAGTPYEKIINKDGVTTEYIRCPDPTANLVAKIIRTEVSG
ncbi:MAG: TIGR04076 family protein [Calditrichia bacterium]